MKRRLIGLLAIIVIGVGCRHDEVTDNSDEHQAPELLRSDEVPTQTDGKKAEINLVANFCASSVPEKQSNMRESFEESSKFRFLELGKIEMSKTTEPLVGDMYGEGWVFFLCDAESHVTIEMVSSSIDPHLVLIKGMTLGTGDILAENDDSGESLNAEISMLLTRGAYRIAALANPEVRGNTGPYLLLADKR